MNAGDHILYVGAQLPKRSETFVYREVLGLRDRGVDVSIASVHPPESDLGDPRLDDLARDAVSVYGRGVWGKLSVVSDAFCSAWVRPPRGLFETPLSYWPKHLLQSEGGYALAHRVRGRGITHVHAHMAHVPTTVAMSCAAALGVPFSFTGHAADLFRDRSALKTKLQRAAFVACISHWHRGFYREILPSLTDAQLPVIRCGVDLTEFAPVAPIEAPQLLAVGRLVAKKGFDVLLRALAKMPIGRLTLVGDGPEARALSELAAELEIRDRVTFAGALSNDAVRDLMGQAAVFVLPCREAADGDRDGIPVVLMEAMARGVCVVSGDLETIRELVADNVGGVMVPPGAVDELADALGRLFAEPEWRARLAAAGRARVTEEFSLSVNLERLQQAFAASRPRPSSRARSASVPSVVRRSAMPTSRRYCLISPTRDEAEFARRTLDSVVNQTCPPTRWVIVDDGSTDDTPAILAEYAAKHDWIHVVTRTNRGERKVGPGVIDAFYAGYETIDPTDFDYVCKIDLDLDLPRGYFEDVMRRMKANPRIGTCSGKAWFPAPSNTDKTFDGELISEACGDEMSVGMIKFYRTDCFTEIGGFVREVMWDGIDCHTCRMYGWVAESYDDAGLRFLHLRPMGSSHKGIFTGRMRHGFGQWFMGTGLAYMTASGVFRMTRPPVFVGGLAMWWGYVKSMLTRKPRYEQPAFRRFLRRYQWACLFKGKAAATRALNESGAARFAARNAGGRPNPETAPATPAAPLTEPVQPVGEAADRV